MPRESLEKNEIPKLCKLLILPPFEKEPKISWFSIEDIAGFHSGEKRKRNDFNNEEKKLRNEKKNRRNLS